MRNNVYRFAHTTVSKINDEIIRSLVMEVRETTECKTLSDDKNCLYGILKHCFYPHPLMKFRALNKLEVEGKPILSSTFDKVQSEPLECAILEFSRISGNQFSLKPGMRVYSALNHAMKEQSGKKRESLPHRQPF